MGDILFRCECLEARNPVSVVVILGVEEIFRFFGGCIKHNPALVFGVNQARLIHTGFNKPVAHSVDSLIRRRKGTVHLFWSPEFAVVRRHGVRPD